jgi:hypothetical protein
MRRFIAIGVATACLTVACGLTPASGQTDLGTVLPPAGALKISALAKQLMSDGSFRKLAVGGTPSRTSAAKLQKIAFKDTAPVSNAAAALASTYPSERQSSVQAGFVDLLALVPAVEKEFAMPHNDLGAATAFFIAASAQSYANIDIDPATQFRPLVAQMRNAIAANVKVTKSSDAAKRQFFDEMMMLGLFQFGLQAGLQKTPDENVSAALRTAGAEYLQTFLGVEPASLQFTSNGLRIGSERVSTTSIQPPALETAPPQPPLPPQPPQLGGSSEASTNSDQIETVAFWSKTKVGFGGFLTFEPTPIVLFRNGDAVYDIEALKFSGGLVAHRSANPTKWTKWRKGGKKFEVQKESGWESLPYTAAMDRLPNGFLLNRTYQSVEGAGTLGVGGSSSVVVWSNLTFDRSGNFSTGGGSGSSTGSDGGAGVVTSGSSPSQQGRYKIDGYTLTLEYADGRVEKRMIVADASDAKVIWLDGTGYTSNP